VVANTQINITNIASELLPFISAILLTAIVSQPKTDTHFNIAGRLKAESTHSDKHSPLMGGFNLGISYIR